MGGVDANLLFHKNYRLSAQFSESFHPGADTNNSAYLIELGQRNHLWNAAIGLERIAPLFEINQTGFLQKEMYRGEQSVSMELLIRLGWVRIGFFWKDTAAHFADFTPKRTLSIGKRKIQIARFLPKFEEDLIAWEETFLLV